MSPDREPTRGQLDIPLVWETGEKPQTRVHEPAAAPLPSPSPRSGPASAGRLVLAAYADLGMTLLALAVAWAAAVAAGVTATVGQLVVIVAVALEAAAVATCCLLWAWRGTPGMLLLDVAFDRPLPAGTVPRVWLAWLGALPFGGFPLLVGRAGRRGIERLAGAALSLRQTPADA